MLIECWRCQIWTPNSESLDRLVLQPHHTWRFDAKVAFFSGWQNYGNDNVDVLVAYKLQIICFSQISVDYIYIYIGVASVLARKDVSYFSHLDVPRLDLPSR